MLRLVLVGDHAVMLAGMLRCMSMIGGMLRVAMTGVCTRLVRPVTPGICRQRLLIASLLRHGIAAEVIAGRIGRPQLRLLLPMLCARMVRGGLIVRLSLRLRLKLGLIATRVRMTVALWWGICRLGRCVVMLGVRIEPLLRGGCGIAMLRCGRLRRVSNGGLDLRRPTRRR